MPITAITLQNFKGIKDPVRIELRPITLLFGPNSAGKSTIIQALHYAHEVLERGNTNPDQTLYGGDTIDLGGFQNFVHKHDKSLPITIRIDMDLEKESLPEYYREDDYFIFKELGGEEIPYEDMTRGVKNAWVEISVRWSELVNRPVVNKYEVGINGEMLARLVSSDDGRQISISELNCLNPLFFGGKGITKNIIVHFKLLKIVFEGAYLGKKADRISRIEAMKEEMEEADDESTDESERTLEEKLGTLYLALSRLVKNSEGSGIYKPINLPLQKSALPLWGESLHLDPEIWEDEVDWEEVQGLLYALSSLIVGPGELVRNALRKFIYLGPIRKIPSRNYRPKLSPRPSNWANGQEAWDILCRADEPFLKKVSEWLSRKQHLNIGYKIVRRDYLELDTTNPIWVNVLQDRLLDESLDLKSELKSLPKHSRLFLWDETNEIEVQTEDVGTGISQVIPVVVAGLTAKTGFVAIEEPEAHVHPGVQVSLGDLFIHQIADHPDVIFLLETHSEHLMLRFLRRIRETNENELPPGKQGLTPDQLSIYFCEKGESGIALTSIRVDKDGEFVDKWPKGFFDERLPEIM